MFLVCVRFTTGREELPNFENLTFGKGRSAVKTNLCGPKKPEVGRKAHLASMAQFRGPQGWEDFRFGFAYSDFSWGDLGRLLTNMDQELSQGWRL